LIAIQFFGSTTRDTHRMRSINNTYTNKTTVMMMIFLKRKKSTHFLSCSSREIGEQESHPHLCHHTLE
jgi:hypothetical protein